ncbi:hypothetical protein HerbRD11066_35200 [Herbidospora sp. RD11066]
MGRITDDTHLDLPVIPADPLAPGQPVGDYEPADHSGAYGFPQDDRGFGTGAHQQPGAFGPGQGDNRHSFGTAPDHGGFGTGPQRTQANEHHGVHSTGPQQLPPNPYASGGQLADSFAPPGHPSPALDGSPSGTGQHPFPGANQPGQAGPFPGANPAGFPGASETGASGPFPGANQAGSFPGSPGGFPGVRPGGIPSGPLSAPTNATAEPLPQRKPRGGRSADAPPEGFDYFGGGAPKDDPRAQQSGAPAGQRIPHTPDQRIPHAAAQAGPMNGPLNASPSGPPAGPPGGPNAPEQQGDWSPWQQRRRSPYDPPSSPLPTQPPGFENFQTDSFAAVGAHNTGGFPESPSMPLPAWAATPPTAAVPGYGDDEEPRPAKKPRSPHLDNVKFVLIALVISSHALRDTINADDVNKAGYIWAFAFHMPLFVMISGYLSRNFWDSKGKVNKLVDTILIPYVVVELGYAALRWGLGGKWTLTITDPAWMNWYLVALLLWRITVPVWKRLRWPFPVAVAVYLISGFSQLEQDFSMDRFFGLLPFFVLGMILQPHHFEWLQKSWVRMVSAFVLAAWTAAAVVLAPELGLKVFYNRFSYADLNQQWVYALGFRLAWMIGVLALCFAVLSIIPKRETWFSDLGTRTLYAYLLHGIPILILKDFGLLKLTWLEGPLGTLAIIASSFVLAIILCLPVTRAVFRWVLEPRLTWLYRKPQSEVQP